MNTLKGTGKDEKGAISTESTTLNQTQFSYKTRFVYPHLIQFPVTNHQSHWELTARKT